ncbi:UNVERIFIED_CONTAM: hypothetical protein FKN15_069853 [Acipenser sinensis]
MLQLSHSTRESMKELFHLLPKRPSPVRKTAANWPQQPPRLPQLAAPATRGGVQNRLTTATIGSTARRRGRSPRPSHKLGSSPRGLLPQAQGPFGALASAHHGHLGAYYSSDRLLTTVQAWSPSLWGVTVNSVTDPQVASVLPQEVAALLQKQAIRIIDPHQLEEGFYSRYFLVPKRDGCLSPILDLRQLLKTVKGLPTRPACYQNGMGTLFGSGPKPNGTEQTLSPSGTRACGKLLPRASLFPGVWLSLGTEPWGEDAAIAL